MTITLSTTAKAVTGLSHHLCQQHRLRRQDGVSAATSHPRLPGAAFTVPPGPFDIVIPLQTPFTFNPAGAASSWTGHFIPTCEATSDFDFDQQATATAVIARVYSFTSTATSGPGRFSGFLRGAGDAVHLGKRQLAVCDRSARGQRDARRREPCLNGASIGGDLTVPPGATATITNSAIGGSVQASGGGAFTLCGSSVGGNVSVSEPQGACSSVTPATTPARPTPIGGSLTLNSDHAGVEVGHDNINRARA